MLSACTIVARNYVGRACVLAESFLATNPGGDFTVLVIDDEDGSDEVAGARTSTKRLRDIGLSNRDIARLAAIYDVTEMATAVKPPFLRQLLSEGRDHILYLDPDIKVYDSLAGIAQLAREHGIVLTPHMLSPLPNDGRRINDAHILSSGVYNLGFIALGRGTDRFIDWWWSKTRREALVDPDHMMFTDQRWIDYAPGFFDPFVLKDPACNVAYWNLHERELTWDGRCYRVNGEPLKFFHFSGFDADEPHLLSRHQGDTPRILLSERPGLRRICAEYQRDLEGASRPLAYGWATLPSGLRFDQRMRRLYRTGLDAFEKGLAPEPPGPFESENAFVDWLNEPVAAGCRPRVSRYLHRLYEERPDLRAAFPDLAGSDCDRYFVWLHGDGVVQERIAPALLPPLRTRATTTRRAFASPQALQPGVNIAGYFRAELGIGEAARLLTRTVHFAGIPCSTLDYAITASRREHPYEAHGDGSAPYDVNIVCVNADRARTFAGDVGPEFFENRYTIGYWFWELEQFPAAMHHGFDVVDEVWAATRFVADGVRRIGRRPVHTIPMAVAVPRVTTAIRREELDLPPGFTFLFMFDFFSTMGRKNPLGLIEAYKRAFGPNEGAALVIKTINGSRRLNDLERLRAAAADRPDIRVVDGYYSAEQKLALMSLSDCYVSLHRSEGFGLTMAEAMGLEKPVIATGYSGNLDFMTPENSYLVDYTTSAVPSDSSPYPAGSLWAEPRLDCAAETMRRVFQSPREAHARAVIARNDILTKHNMQVASVAIARRLEEIRRSRETVAVAAADDRALTPATLDAGATGAAPGLAAAASLPTQPASPKAPWLAQCVIRARRMYWRQRQLRATFVDVLRGAATLATRSQSLEVQQRNALASVWSALHELESKHHQLQQEADAIRRAQQGTGVVDATPRLTEPKGERLPSIHAVEHASRPTGTRARS